MDRQISSAALGGLRRRWWLPLITMGAAVGVAWIWTSRAPRIYQSSSTLVVVPSSDVKETSDVLRSLETLERRSVIATFARIPGTAETREAIRTTLALQREAVGAYRLNGSVLPNTNAIRVEAEGPDPQLAARIANAAAEITAREASALYRIYSMRQLAAAVPAHRPVRPEPIRNALAAAILGLFIGALAALAFDYLAGSPARIRAAA